VAFLSDVSVWWHLPGVITIVPVLAIGLYIADVIPTLLRRLKGKEFKPGP
jgi:hypothetical protein